MGGMDLAEVPIDELVAEVSRRMHCLDKPEKRVIMVGEDGDAFQMIVKLQSDADSFTVLSSASY